LQATSILAPSAPDSHVAQFAASLDPSKLPVFSIPGLFRLAYTFSGNLAVRKSHDWSLGMILCFREAIAYLITLDLPSPEKPYFRALKTVTLIETVRSWRASFPFRHRLLQDAEYGIANRILISKDSDL
jgi:hypothetical protein